MEDKILKMNLLVNIEESKSNNDIEYIVQIINAENNNDDFKFKLSDETTDSLKNFIDYLLRKINEYDKLDIIFPINENSDSHSLKNIIGLNIKEVWESEFLEIKNIIKNI